VCHLEVWLTFHTRSEVVQREYQQAEQRGVDNATLRLSRQLPNWEWGVYITYLYLSTPSLSFFSLSSAGPVLQTLCLTVRGLIVAILRPALVAPSFIHHFCLSRLMSITLYLIPGKCCT
jgi:hypothetical protein